jgi:uncharacterized protein involved in outer membrane biogenesis
MTDMRRRRTILWLALGVPAGLLVLLTILWKWDWVIPLVDARASAAIGRNVTIAHLHVRPGRVTTIVADNLRIADPENVAPSTPFVRVSHLKLQLNVLDYLFHQRIVIPFIDLDHPTVSIISTAPGKNNYTARFPPSSTVSTPAPVIGQIAIEDGQVHAVMTPLKANFNLAVATKTASGVVAQHAQPEEIAVDINGTYAGQPIDGTLIGGDVLSLRNSAQPYPIDLHLANGATDVSLVGTVDDPVSFKGADFRLVFAGDNMANLYPLTGIPIPATPRYQVAGQLAYVDHRIRFQDFAGTVGNSDLSGTITEAPGNRRPDVTMDLHSQRVDLADLGGFLGTTPGGAHETGATPAQRAQVAAAEAKSPNLLPTTPINIPKLRAADIQLNYRAEHIEGRSMPLDQLIVAMDVVNGAIDLHPITFTVGDGKISGDVALTPVSDDLVHAKADVHFNHVDVSTLMAATHVFHGAGSISGRAELDSVGNSIASWAADGNGGLSLSMSGGDLSAVLVDLSGLEFGNALISALGIPRDTNVRCFIGDFGLNHGIVDTRAILLDTGQAIVRGSGTIDLRDQRIDYRISAKPKHFSIGSLSAPIDITGTLKDPGIAPAVAPLAERGAAAVALGILAAPLAILPTIQLGVNDPHQCADLVREVQAQARSGNPGAKLGAATASPSGSGSQKANSDNGATGAFQVTGRGDAAVRQLNREELERIK